MNITLRNKLAVAFCIAMLGLGTTACNDDNLNPIPETLISDQVVFDTPTRIELQVNNLYAYVKTGAFYGGRYTVYGDVRADDFINRTTNSVTAFGVWAHALTPTSQNDVVNLWAAAYQSINQANVFLAGMDANAAKFVAPTFPATFATTAEQYKAEARLLRALSYYSLLQLYARPYADGAGSKPGLPLRLQAETTLAGNDLARSTVAEVYTQILADLQFAENNLPLTYTGNAAAAPNITRAHRNTAIALKTRVLLSMQRYADVVTEANKIVSTTAPFTATTGVSHALNPSISAVFASPQETSESIFSFPFTAQNAPGTQNQLAGYFTPTPVGNGEFFLNTSGILGNPAWSATDARKTSFVFVSGGASYLRKYASGTPYLDKSPVIRYAEVLLNLAEGLARTSATNIPRALELLNAVRGRSNGSLYPATISQQDLINAILLERRIEFVGEGLRNIDIMRLYQPIPGKSSVPAIPTSDPRYVWPIPAAEIQTNALIVQNDGY